jgi:uncharacterized protein (TIGR00269 family)
MRQHRLALCAEHFIEWVPRQVARTIEKYAMFTPEERVLLAVSGGKDSLALWDILLRLGYQVDGLHINLGIEQGYSAASQARVEEFVATRPGTRLYTVDLSGQYGASVPELVRQRRGRKPCSVCGLVKRHIMNQKACEGGYAAIVTGHNLDDEVAVLLQNALHWNVGYLARQAPVLPPSPAGLARKVKPLVRLREREVAAYAILRGIDYIYDECPHAQGATTLYYKDIMNQLEARSRGTKEMFYLGFLRARSEMGLPGPELERVELHPCSRCGQPTTAPELCAFCRLWAGEHVRESGEFDGEF